MCNMPKKAYLLKGVEGNVFSRFRKENIKLMS